ncbi:unnamed protein product [Pleuronectes platessa]|uniref:Uncharacterized protein n=1 Tax=Pleuronectes platessa TaxID=8262 RepID=A0A9N7VT82_PLEPL|nr:unnamed protein product [Pleuronectes platessa]
MPLGSVPTAEAFLLVLNCKAHLPPASSVSIIIIIIIIIINNFCQYLGPSYVCTYGIASMQKHELGLILVNSITQPALLYENVVVSDGSPLLRDLLFGPEHQYLYTLNDKRDVLSSFSRLFPPHLFSILGGPHFCLSQMEQYRTGGCTEPPCSLLMSSFFLARGCLYFG